MNILFVPTEDPRLKNAGNEQRTNHLWESLKRYGRVYTFLLDRTLDSSSEMTNDFHPICKVRPEKNRFSIWNILDYVLSRLSFFSMYRRKTITFNSPEMVFKGVHFDIVVLRYVYPLCDYAYWKIAPMLLDIDDHPYQVYETVRKQRLPIGLKTIGMYVTRWQANTLINKAVGGWITNNDQIDLLGKTFGLLPNIPQMPSNSYRCENKDRKNLFTVGAMGYGPNREGISRFLRHIWPIFHEKYPDVNYIIAGKGASADDVEYWNSFDGVNYLGFVDNLEAIYEDILATVVPVYSGGGTCIKTLESMAYSRSCLSTRFGARGLPVGVVERGTGVLVFNDAASFIDAYSLIQNPNDREEIESGGRDLIARYYSVECFNKGVDVVMRQCI